MTKFERCWIYILVILVAVSNLLTLARVRELEGKIAEMQQEEPAEPATVSLRMARRERRRRAQRTGRIAANAVGRVHGLCLLRV